MDRMELPQSIVLHTITTNKQCKCIHHAFVFSFIFTSSKAIMKSENTLPATSSPTASRKRWRLPLAALILMGAAGGGWMTMHAKKSDAMAKAEAKAGDKKPTVFELSAGDIATIDARELRLTLPVSGSLSPLMQTTVKAKVAAEVRETLVQEGMKVTRGQIIARLDSADLRPRWTRPRPSCHWPARTTTPTRRC
jgi:hypothetical protein